MGSRRGYWKAVLLLVAAVLPLLAIVLGVVPPGFGLISAGTLVSWLLWRIRGHAASLLLVFLTVALAGTIIGQPWLNLKESDLAADDGGARADLWAAGGRFDERLPVVLHLVFDELISSGGIDPTLPGGAETVLAMKQVASTQGLRLYDSVYSRFYYSGVSIPNMMHAEYLGHFALGDVNGAIASPGRDTAYFADMERRGYRTAVFETTVITFCGARNVTWCETFPSYDPGVVSGAGLDERTRSVYLWDSLLRAYEPGYLPALGRWVLRYFYGLDQRELGVLGAADRFDVQGFPAWFDRFASFVSRVPRGSHVFAHFLVPHSPYLLTDACVVSGEFDSGYRLNERLEGNEAREGARRVYYQQYLAQARCVMSKLDSFLSEIRSDPELQDALVVIHGDHGSRISAGAFVEEVAPRDLVDNHAAFFAVRGPGIDPGLDCGFTSLSQIFRRTMKAGDTQSEQSPPLPLLVNSQAGADVLVEMKMPVFGCAASGQDSKTP